MPGLVAVTGATGFIGRTLIQKLTESGWVVRALTRTYRPDSDSIQWIQGDLDNLTALHRLVNDAAYVIHCAATVRGGSFQEFSHTNITGTRNLISAVSETKQVPRFLLISSLAARESGLSWYAKSKYLSEQQLFEYSDQLQWTIFRPTAVYGPGDKELKPLFQAMSRGILPVVGEINNRFGLIHVHDLVAAIQFWLTSETKINGIFELDDGMIGGYSYHSLTELAQQVWQRPVRCVTVPNWLIRNIAAFNLQLAHLLHYSPMLTPGKVNELQHNNWVCDNTPLIRALPAWRPQIHLQDALTEVI